MKKSFLLLLLAALALPAVAGAQSHTLLLVLDGLRPDYITPELMPNLHALGERGVVCEKHHAVYPTVTRVNASTFSTGAYPETHGLLGNTVYFPDVDERSLSTSSRDNLLRIEEATGGNLLQARTLGEHLDAAGKKLLVLSSGSSGSSFLLNHKGAGAGIIHVDYVVPETLQPALYDMVGAVPAEAMPNVDRNRWIVDAYLKVGLDTLKPDVAYIWLSEPDSTAHAFGVGHAKTVAALASVDSEVGHIIEGLEARGMLETTDILVSSDHGFSDYVRSPSVMSLVLRVLEKHGLSRDDAVFAGGACYLSDAAKPHLAEVVEELQRAPFVGALFTRARAGDETRGVVPGTLSQSFVRWQHPRSADLLISPNWNDDENTYGWKGKTLRTGIAGHGSSSPFDIHNTLLVAGPGFDAGRRSAMPTHNVDIAPTIARLQGLAPLPDADGRVLEELFANAEDGKVEPVTQRYETKHTDERGNTYTLTAIKTHVGDANYLDYTEVSRTQRQFRTK